jgi:hypothetical protein
MDPLRSLHALAPAAIAQIPLASRRSDQRNTGRDLRRASWISLGVGWRGPTKRIAQPRWALTMSARRQPLALITRVWRGLDVDGSVLVTRLNL